MKRILIICLIALTSAATCLAQQQTTLILVRHAEKVADGTKDPALSEEGIVRANRLAAMLESQSIHAIYSTPYQRTRLTVAPLAAKKNLNVQDYDPTSKTFVSDLIQKNKGGTIVVVGHSNTVPGLLNQLIGKEEFQNFDDADYGNLIIVSAAEGATAPKITWLRY